MPTVTAKDVVNLRSIPSVTDEEAQVLGQLKKGDTAQRTGISNNGWSRLEWNGQVCYAVTNYLEVVGAQAEEVFCSIRAYFISDKSFKIL